jgi:hypothetical protein
VFPDAVDGVSYDAAMGRGHDEWWWRVQGIVSTTSDKGAQVSLDAWVDSAGDQSVKQALEADRTLGGEAADVQVVDCTGYQEYIREGGISVLSCVWLVRVLASGT